MKAVKSCPEYNRGRLIAVAFVMAMNAGLMAAGLSYRQYPMGVAAILFLIPPLLRELDLRSGRPARRLGVFEWSCLVGGLLFLLLPLFLR